MALLFQPFPSSTSIHANENIQSKKEVATTTENEGQAIGRTGLEITHEKPLQEEKKQEERNKPKNERIYIKRLIRNKCNNGAISRYNNYGVFLRCGFQI